MDMVWGILKALLGIGVMLSICYIMSDNRKKINWKLIRNGLLIQLALAAIFFYTPASIIIEKIANGIGNIIKATDRATTYVLGEHITTSGFSILIKVLPTIIIFSVISSILYHFNILPRLVKLMAKGLKKLMPISGSESLAAVANVFIGQTEAPLIIKPYLAKMNRSEMLCLMVGGMATIAGGVLAVYMQLLGKNDDSLLVFYGKHFITASIISAPAAILIAKILSPNPSKAVDDDIELSVETNEPNVLGAITTGTTEGLKLAINVGAMLLVFTALIYMLNSSLLWLGDITHFNSWFNEFYPVLLDGKPLVDEQGAFIGAFASDYTITDGVLQVNNHGGIQLEYILGLLFYPIAWLIGIDGQNVFQAAQMLGIKTILNEFFAYLQLSDAQHTMTTKSTLIMTYALCGFANFASIGIQIGGISALAPNQRITLSKLGIKALVGGTIACLLTGTIAGILYEIQSLFT